MSERYDVAVIGGGIAGVSAAAALSTDARVIVLDAGDALGTQASGRSAAMFEEAYGAETVRALNRASRARHEAAGVLSPRGLMIVSKQRDLPVFEDDLVTMNMERIDLSEARRRVPILSDDIVAAGLHEDAMDIDTDLLLQSYAKTVRANGGRVALRAPVSAIARTDGIWRLVAGDLEVDADLLVDAAGAWADLVATMAGVAPVGLQPYRRSMARLPAPGGHDVSAWPMLFGPGETWYAKPDAGALLVSPADEDASEPMDAWADDMVLAEGLARYEAHVTEPVTRLLTSWAGLRTFAPDRTLVIGRDPVVPEFFWLAGQGGYGFQTAPAAAALAADLAMGRASEMGADFEAAVSPGRFS